MSKVISRSKIVGMHVYNPDGYYVGTVKDVGFTLDEGRPILIVTTRYQTSMEIGWSNIGAVGDIVILKEPVEVKAPETPSPAAGPAPSAAPAPAAPAAEEEKGAKFPIRLPKVSLKKEVPRCPYCGGELTYIKEYDRWYCYNCKTYPPLTGT